MKVAKKKKDKKKKRTPKGDPNKYYMVTDARIEEIKDEMAEEATYRACMVFLGNLADMGWKEEQLLDLFDRFARSNEFAVEGLLPCEDVQRIVNEHTGITFERKWYG